MPTNEEIFVKCLKEQNPEDIFNLMSRLSAGEAAIARVGELEKIKKSAEGMVLNLSCSLHMEEEKVAALQQQLTSANRAVEAIKNKDIKAMADLCKEYEAGK